MSWLNWFGSGKQYDPKTDQTSIGNVLVKRGYISRDQLDQYVARFRDQVDMRIGEFMVGEGAITQDQLETALLHQQMMRGDKSALAAMMKRTRQKHDTISLTIDELVVATRQVVADNGGHDGNRH